MRYNNLKKLKREDLLEILVEQGKEIERLEQALDEAERKLKDRTINVENIGTMAEAALKLSHIFEDADSAAKQYLDNIKKRSFGTEKSYDKLENHNTTEKVNSKSENSSVINEISGIANGNINKTEENINKAEENNNKTEENSNTTENFYEKYNTLFGKKT